LLILEPWVVQRLKDWGSFLQVVGQKRFYEFLG
jgi:hypothetical protein